MVALSTEKDKVAIIKIDLEDRVVSKRKIKSEARFVFVWVFCFVCLFVLLVTVYMPVRHVHGNGEETLGYIRLQLKGAAQAGFRAQQFICPT